MLLTVLLTIFLLLPPIILGYKEGMIMLQDGDSSDMIPGDKVGGVKSHFLFKYMYHYSNIIAGIMVFLVGFLFGYTRYYIYIDYGYFIFYFLAMFLLMYQMSEMSYSYSRWRKFIPNYENFWLGQHINYRFKNRNEVINLYFWRTIFGLIFLIISFQ